MPNEPKSAILLATKQKKGLQSYASGIPTPTPDSPGERLVDMIAQSRFLGKSGGGFCTSEEDRDIGPCQPVGFGTKLQPAGQFAVRRAS